MSKTRDFQGIIPPLMVKSLFKNRQIWQVDLRCGGAFGTARTSNY